MMQPSAPQNDRAWRHGGASCRVPPIAIEHPPGLALQAALAMLASARLLSA